MSLGMTPRTARLSTLRIVGVAFAAALAFGTSVASAVPASVLQTSTAQTSKSCDTYTSYANWTKTGADSLHVAQFNPALGTLRSVSVDRTVTDQSQLGNENVNPNSGATITFEAQSAVTLSVPGVSPDLALNRDSGQKTYQVPAYTGLPNDPPDYTGPSGRELDQPLLTQTDTVSPSTTAAYVGTGQVQFPATATANNVNTINTGNGNAKVRTTDGATVCVTYTYDNSAIGDCVVNDLNHNGIQDAGEPGVSGIRVTLYIQGQVAPYETTTTGSTGCYAFNNIPCQAYTVVFGDASAVNGGLPAGFVTSPTNAGAPDVDSNGLSSSTDLSVCGINPTVDLLIYNTTPPVVTPPGVPPVTTPTPVTPVVLAASTPPTATAAAAPNPTKLVIKKDVIGRTTNFQRGGNASFRITVTNVGAYAATNVQTCDVLPKLLSFVSVRGATYTNGNACWKIVSLAAGKSVTYNVTVKIDRSAPKCSHPINVGRATATNAAAVQASRRITACSAVLAAAAAPAVTG